MGHLGLSLLFVLVNVGMTHSSLLHTYTFLGFLTLINQMEILHGLPMNASPNGQTSLPNLADTKLSGNVAEMVYVIKLPNAQQTVLLNSNGEVVAKLPSSMFGAHTKSAATSVADGSSFKVPKRQTALESIGPDAPPVQSNRYKNSGNPDLFPVSSQIDTGRTQKSQKLISDIRNILKSRPSRGGLKKLLTALNISSASKPSREALKKLKTALNIASNFGGKRKVGSTKQVPKSSGGSSTGSSSSQYAQSPVLLNEPPAKKNIIPAKGTEITQKPPKLIFDILNILKSKPSRGALKNLQTALNSVANFGGSNKAGPTNQVPESSSSSSTVGSSSQYAQSPVLLHEPSTKENIIPAKDTPAGLSGSSIFEGQVGKPVLKKGDPFGPQNMPAETLVSESQTGLSGSAEAPVFNSGAPVPVNIKNTPSIQTDVPQVHHHHIHGVNLSTILFGLMNRHEPKHGIPSTGNTLGRHDASTSTGRGGTSGGSEWFAMTGENFPGNKIQPSKFQAIMSQLIKVFKNAGIRSVGSNNGTGLQDKMSAASAAKLNKGAPGTDLQTGPQGSGSASAPDPANAPDPGEVNEAAAEAAAEAAEAQEAATSQKKSAQKPSKTGTSGTQGNSKSANSQTPQKSKNNAGAAADIVLPVGTQTAGNEQSFQRAEGTQVSYTEGKTSGGRKMSMPSSILRSSALYNEPLPKPNQGGKISISAVEQNLPNPPEQMPYPGGGLSVPARRAARKREPTVPSEVASNAAAIVAAEAAENIEAGVRANPRVRAYPNANQWKSRDRAVQDRGANPVVGMAALPQAPTFMFPPQVSPQRKYGPPADAAVASSAGQSNGQNIFPGPSLM